MKIISRKYGVDINHVRYVIFRCSIQQREEKLNDKIKWKVKRNWEFDLIKYELQDHCIIRFEELEDSVFIIKLMDYSEHDVYDDLYKHESDEYLKYMIMFHLTKLFENRLSFPQYIEHASIFEQHIQMA